MPNLIASPSDDDVMAALRAFILALLPDVGGTNVIQGQQNKVPMPVGPDFIIFTPSSRDQLATTVRDYDPTAGTRSTSRSTRVAVQIDFYGPNSTNNAQVFSTMFRDLYGCDFFTSYQIQPLWSDDGRQMPLVNGEEQYEERWMVRTLLQVNPTISTSQDFMANVAVKLVEAD